MMGQTDRGAFIAERNRLISTKEAADLLGVNRATVVNWARQGKFVGHQYGQRGIYRFDRQQILEFIDRSRLTSRSNE